MTHGTDQWGTTFMTRTADRQGRIVGDLTIAILSGLPHDMFRMVLVHEYGHAYLTSGGYAPAAPLIAQEGFCEALSYDYLRRELPSRRATHMSNAILNNPDPIYGQGVRMMMPAIAHHGFQAVARAVATDNLGAVGVTVPGDVG